MKFTDARWEAGQVKDWDTPKESHPHLCDTCKQSAVAVERQAAGKCEHQEPVLREAEQYNFQRSPNCPVCTECGATFTDEWWQATERVSWNVSAEPRPSLCGDCDRQFVTDIQEAWSDEPPHQEQAQALPTQKSGPWFSRRT